MALKSLAYTAAETKALYKPTPLKMEEPRYPYGLEITLDKHCLKKLGLGVADFVVGETLSAEVMFLVKSVSISRSESYGGHETVSLCIMMMDLGTPEAEKADLIYGESYGKKAY